MTRTIHTDPLTVRRAGAQDRPQLRRLAALDSSYVPSGEVLVVDSSGRLLAALSLQDGAAVADPFEHTGQLVDLLRVRAAQLGRAPAPTRGYPLRALVGARASS